jgi:prophage tail gpP-like protein
MPVPESKLVVKLPNLGRETVNLKAWEIQSSYLTAADGFSFTLVEPDFELSRNLELQPVELYLDGNLQMVGRIDRTRRGRDGIAVVCDGRDYLADLIECHTDLSLKLKAESSLEQAILDAAGPVGIAKVIGDDAGARMRKLRTGASISGGAAPKDFAPLKQDEYKPKPSEGIFQFLNRLAARHCGTLQPTGRSDTIAIAAPDYGQDVTFVLQRYREPTRVGNVKDGEAVRDYSSFPTVLLATGKRGAKGEPKQTLFTQIQAELETRLQDLIATDRRLPKNNPGDITQLYRLWYMREEMARTPEQIQKAAQRAYAERFRKTLEYSCTVRGHRGDGGNDAMYAIDTLARVDDEIADVAEDMWVESVTLSYSRDAGPKTDLKLWRKSAFVI